MCKVPPILHLSFFLCLLLCLLFFSRLSFLLLLDFLEEDFRDFCLDAESDKRHAEQKKVTQDIDFSWMDLEL